ncbi:MAG TPA: LysR substrate-binding domain-containing protein [Steroidobacteraceae bacterium]|nr:LysR substrate-binding domain-containing protein [Steroidobacteraceae bacterium]
MPTKIDLRKLPPLNALKGFEAATRRQSVREAADELFLTHPAVSYQIQVLEQDLGVELFSRAGRSLAPTAEGRLFYGYVRQALETLIEGVESVRRARADSPLRVQTYITASIRWLARKLPDFVAAHPDIKVLLTTYAFDWAFDDTIADVGLVYCEKEPGPEYCWIPLFDYRLHAVCSPALARPLGPTPSPAALLTLPLVAIYSESHHWDLWCESARLVYDAKPAIVVDTLAVALEIALAGRGVALVNGPFDTDLLASGQLVQPVSHEYVCPGSWGLICRRESQDNPRVKAFMDWLVRAAQPTDTKPA